MHTEYKTKYKAVELHRAPKVSAITSMTNFFWLSFLAVSLLGYMSASSDNEYRPAKMEVLRLFESSDCIYSAVFLCLAELLCCYCPTATDEHRNHFMTLPL